MRSWTAVAAAILVAAPACAQDAPPREALEQVDGALAMHWVTAQNEKTTQTLERDPRYKTFYDQVLSVEQSPERLAAPEQVGGAIYNFWQDASHKRGIWRQSGTHAFETGHPEWTTILDVDRLAATEHVDWVFQGANCLEPGASKCLIALSKAGQDANTLREFDPVTRRFVPGGFDLPDSKQTAVWMSGDALLVSREWGEDPKTLTKSGYPYIVKVLPRGVSMGAGREIARGTQDDMAVHPLSLRDERGRTLFLIARYKDFFNVEYKRVDPQTLTVSSISLPPETGFLGYYAGRIIARLDADWTVEGETYPKGSLVSIDPQARQHGVSVVFKPGDRESTGDVDIGGSGVVAVVYDHVEPRLSIFSPAGSAWRERRIALPAQTSATIASASVDDADTYIKLQGYIVPPQLWRVNTRSGQTSVPYRTPDLFKADNLVTEQFWSHSPDGTLVPYFVVHAKDWQLDGHNPALFTAYGGFDLSYLPTYYPDLGKTWFERGGVYIVGNIRGGGEFGPAWHEAGMKSGRQRAYDDFASIARDLVARKITDASHLAIRGRSNGGLLMGVEFTQHPDLWKAVIIGVPLLDMLNFEHMAAGASWAAEYGRTAVPEERAFLARISPLQNLKPGIDYPVPFIFTSTKDDRVGPVHARLFASRLEALGKPFFYYEDTEGGHAGTVNAREVAHERALEAVYLSRSVMDRR